VRHLSRPARSNAILASGPAQSAPVTANYVAIIPSPEGGPMMYCGGYSAAIAIGWH